MSEQRDASSNWDFDLPWDELGAAVRYASDHLLCSAGEPHVGPDAVRGSDHGHSACWSIGQLILAADKLKELESRMCSGCQYYKHIGSQAGSCAIFGRVQQGHMCARFTPRKTALGGQL